MKRKGKKFLTILLSVMIVVTYMVPGSVFAETTRAAGDLYELVDSLEDGGEYLIVNTNSAGTAYALTNSGSSSLGKTEVTISDDLKISAPSEDVIWTAATNGEGFNLSNGGSYMEGVGGEVTIVTSLQYSTRHFTYENNQLAHVGGRNTYVVYYDGSKYTSTYNSTNEKVYIYKKAAAGTASVTGVTLDQTSLTLKQGKTATLKATVAPTDAADKTVSWATSDDTVATVSNGKVTAEGPGTATITVTTNDGGFTAQCAVTVEAAELETYVLVDEPVYGESYLIVSSNSAGSAYALTNPGGTSGGAAMAATPVTITEKNGSLTISADKDDTSILWKTTKNGEGFTLTNGSDYIETSGGKIAIFNPVKNADRYWKYEDNVLSHGGGSSSNWYILYYDNGFAYTYNGTGGKVYFFGVPGTASVTGVTLDQATMNLKEGKTATLTATVAPADAANKAVSWSTSDDSVATVDNGKVTAVGAGTATIIVTTEDGGFTATCQVTVAAVALETYELIDTPLDGETYRIVSSNQAGDGFMLTNPGGTSGGASMAATPVTLTSSGGKVTLKADDGETSIFWKWTANGERFNLTNGTDYLEGKSGEVKIFSSQQYADRGWTYEGGQLRHLGGNNTYVVYYSNGFTSTYDSSDAKIYFFGKKTGGDDPIEPDPIPVDSVSLDKTSISLEVGKTATLTATVLPDNATDKTVTWRSNDTDIATVSNAGVVTAKGEGTTTIRATAGEKSATCSVTVTEKTVTGQAVNVGVSSDIHGSVDRLEAWLTAVQNTVDPDLDSMLYCGDYSYQMSNLESFVSDFQSIVSVTNTIVGEGKAVYTSGNHEYYIGNREIPLDERFTSTPGFVRLGEALVRPNYIVYCMGAAGWYNGIGTFPQDDIDALESYLASAPTDIPILILSHFPLHMNSSRTITNADKVIEVLNDHPNTVFFWGHNHSQAPRTETHYGDVLVKGDTLTYASNKSSEINFTYACAGGMYQDNQTEYSGVVLSISADGSEVSFQYYNATSGQTIGDSTTIHIDGTAAVKHTITASAGANGTITPSGEVQVTDGKSKEFSFKADTGYKIDTVTVDGEAIADPGKSYTFENVTEDHTINVTFKAKDPSESNYYKLVDAFKDGEEYLIVNTNAAGSGYVLTNPGATSDGASMTATSVDISEGDIDNDGTEDKYIAMDQENIVWTTTASGQGFYLTNDGAFLGGKGGNVRIYTSNPYSDRYWTYSDNKLTFRGSGTNTVYTVYYSNGFASSSSSSGSGSSSNKIYIYEKTEYVAGTDAVTGVELDESEIRLLEGKTHKLTARVLPTTAADKSVTWSSSDEEIATVDQTGLVTAVAEGTATITVTTTDGSFTANCQVTVDPYVPGSGVNVGVTSDVHGNITGLGDWLTTIQEDYDPDMDSVLYCGDYSYNMNNLDDYIADFNQVVSTTNTIIGEGKGVYTSGNHEYYIGSREIPLDESFTSTPGFVRLGEALVKEDYIVYCMGAASWGNNAVGEYPQADIDALEAYLESAPSDIPILIPAHFPLHFISGRTVTNADKVIAVLNEHPNAIFFWGHNHSQNDPHYGQIVKARGSIEYASGKSSEINFTYACAGGMYQDSQTQYSGVVVHIDKADQGYDLTFQYYRATTGEPIGDETTLHLEDNETVKHTITATAGENGAISPEGAVSVRDGADRTFTFRPAAGYEAGEVKVDDEAVTIEGEKYTFTGVTEDHTISVTFRKADVTEYILTDVANDKGNYMVVSNGFALINDGGTIGAVPVQMSEDGKSVFVRTGDLEKNIIWTLKAATTTETSGAFTVENGGLKLSRVSGGSEGGADNPAEITEEEKVSEYSGLPYYQWSYDVENSLLTMVGGQNGDSTFYFYYNESEGKFYTTTTENNTGLYIPATPEIVWGEPTYTWAEDNSTCTAKRIGTDGISTTEEQETVAAGDVVVKNATCEEDGREVFTAVFKSEVFETQTKEIVLPKLNHDWEFTGFEWEDDFSAASAVFTCKNDSTHVQKIGASIYTEITQSTCTTAGSATYTATVAADLSLDGKQHVDVGTKEIPPKNHDYARVGWNWASDYSKATLTFKCKVCDHEEIVPAEITQEISEPTCLEDGRSVYTAVVEFEGSEYTSVKDITLSKLGHDWGEPTWSWTGSAAEGYTAAEATFICLRDEEHTKTIEADIREKTDAATCEADGKITYTASVTLNGEDYSDTKEKILPALGHSWSTPIYEWAEDNSTVVATRVCKHDPDHVETETAEAEAEVTKPATCEEKGETTYTATFKNAAFKTQTKTLVNVPATGHDWGEVKYEWAEDHSTVTASRVCKHDATHVETETARASSVKTKEPTCETKGETTYSATFRSAVFEAQTETVADIPALGHDWKFVNFKWAGNDEDGYEEAVADYRCQRDTSHKKSVDAVITKESTDATCTTPGTVKYTATIAAADALDGEARSESKTVTGQALGHDWGEVKYEWAEDNSTVTATRVCKNDATHVETETAEVMAKITKAATCEAKGETTYTATFKNAAFKAQTKTLADIDALGHDWAAITYDWAKDNSTVTATRVCKNDAAHTITETAEVVAKITKAATCEAKGETTYTAEFENEIFETQTKVLADIAALGHDWAAITYEWADDNSTVVATRVCKNDAAHTVTETAEVVAKITKAATCEAKGETTYTAEFKNEIFETQTKTLANIDALGHDWKFVNFKWAGNDEEGYEEVVVDYKCARDGAHKKSVEATITKASTDATCTVAGTVTYTAAITAADALDGEARTENRTVVGQPLGHDWGEVKYEWATDNSSVTATRVCKHDATHVETETAQNKGEVTKPATCEGKGETTYTAEFKNAAFKTQTKTVADVEALGHDWKFVNFKWAGNDTEGYEEAVVDYKCSRDGAHKKSVDATITKESTAATCTTPGKDIYTASISAADALDGEARSESKTVVTVAALGHDWGEVKYEWAEDDSTVTATRVCKRDATHVETETAQVEAKVTKPATCEAKGETTYTATFKNAAFETQTKTLVNIEATGHDWGEPTYEWAKDNSTVTAKRVCKHDPSHVEKETVYPDSEDTIDPGCTEEGQDTLVATFESEYFATQTKIMTLPATGHFYSEYKLVTKATTTKSGKLVKTCEICDKKITMLVAPVLCKAKVVTSTKAKLTWTKVSGAQRYVVYFADCGKSGTKKVAMTANLSYTRAGLKKGETYKFKVVAQRKIDSKWKDISTGFLGHFASGDLTADKLYTNAKSISVAKDTVSIKKGKTSQIKPSVTPVKSGKEVLSKGHNVEVYRYTSSNTAIAKVSASGKITAVKKGTCKIYVVAPNGVWKEISVTVK